MMQLQGIFTQHLYPLISETHSIYLIKIWHQEPYLKIHRSWKIQYCDLHKSADRGFVDWHTEPNLRDRRDYMNHCPQVVPPLNMQKLWNPVRQNSAFEEAMRQLPVSDAGIVKTEWITSTFQRCKMSSKVHFLYSHLEFLRNDLCNSSDEYEVCMK